MPRSASLKKQKSAKNDDDWRKPVMETKIKLLGQVLGIVLISNNDIPVFFHFLRTIIYYEIKQLWILFVWREILFFLYSEEGDIVGLIWQYDKQINIIIEAKYREIMVLTK